MADKKENDVSLVIVIKKLLETLKDPIVQKRIKEQREKSDAILKEIQASIRVSPEKMKMEFNI